jgi:integral membrane protein
VSSVQDRPNRAPVTARRRPIGPALVRYRVMAWITGVMLLLLVAEMVVKYGFLDGSAWAGDLIAIAHGWVYVVYLVTVFDLWSKLRWPFGRFVALVLAGVVPVLSFVVERRIVREVRASGALW